MTRILVLISAEDKDFYEIEESGKIDSYVVIKENFDKDIIRPSKNDAEEISQNVKKELELLIGKH